MGLGNKSFVIISMLFLLAGCATQNNIKQTSNAVISAPFSASSLAIKLSAQPDLNTVNGLPNSCTVLVIQTQTLDQITQLISNAANIQMLFSDEGAGGTEKDVLQVDRYTLMPGQSTTLHLDRVINSRYVGIVAGYYPFPTQQQMLTLAIPVHRYSTGWWTPEEHAELTPLSVSLRLGSSGFIDIQSNTDLVPENNKYIAKTDESH